MATEKRKNAIWVTAAVDNPVTTDAVKNNLVCSGERHYQICRQFANKIKSEFGMHKLSMRRRHTPTGMLLILTTFLLIFFSTNDVFADIHRAFWNRCETSNRSDYGSRSCGTCRGIKAWGKGFHYCGGGCVTDYSLDSGLTSVLLPTKQVANVFIFDDEDSVSIANTIDTTNPIGIGYIGATAYYNHIYNGDTSHFYVLYNAIEIADYSEWLAVCQFLSNVANYVGGKALVYPDPTSSTAFIKLNDTYLSSKNIQSASYQLFNPSMALITTITDVANIVQIPSNYITSYGMYTVICNITYLDANNQLSNEVFTLTFIGGTV